MDRRGERSREHGLADAGHVLDQEVPLREDRDEHGLDRMVLPVDHPAHIGGDLLGGRVELLGRHRRLGHRSQPSVGNGRMTLLGWYRLSA
jgi:hypothetical protein